jgi:hypothetical protein
MIVCRCTRASLPCATYNHYKAEGKAQSLDGLRRNTSNFVVFPRSSYLKEIDPEGTMTKDQVQALTHDDIVLFAELMDNPDQFDMNHPNMTWDEILRLHGHFQVVLCQPNRQRWGRWGLWNCGCDEDFKDAICGPEHSTLLALLFDKTLMFPPEDSSKKLPTRSIWSINEAKLQCPLVHTLDTRSGLCGRPRHYWILETGCGYQIPLARISGPE